MLKPNYFIFILFLFYFYFHFYFYFYFYFYFIFLFFIFYFYFHFGTAPNRKVSEKVFTTYSDGSTAPPPSLAPEWRGTMCTKGPKRAPGASRGWARRGPPQIRPADPKHNVLPMYFANFCIIATPNSAKRQTCKWQTTRRVSLYKGTIWCTLGTPF